MLLQEARTANAHLQADNEKLRGDVQLAQALAFLDPTKEGQLDAAMQEALKKLQDANREMSVELSNARHEAIDMRCGRFLFIIIPQRLHQEGEA